MTPEQFLDGLRKSSLAPVYLFLGPEPFQKERCRRALIESVLGTAVEDRENGFSVTDLYEVPLASALDDARSLSLFASRRVIWLTNAEAAVPRGKAAAADADDGDASADNVLADYLREPTEGTVIVFDASRYGFDGEDKVKLERVQKYFTQIPSKVEFRPYAPEAARALAQSLAKQAGLQLGLAELALLIEATGGDAMRLSVEIEKLSLYAGTRKVTARDIATLVSQAQSSTIFALVGALGRGDRIRALEILDILAREGEYMPLALTFLGTQFRMALTARDAKANSASQIQAQLSQMGARIWPDRARQIEETVRAFSKGQLEKAVEKIFAADRDLRDARPDDRIVMEEMVVSLTDGARR